jgi:hypothetical protein
MKVALAVKVDDTHASIETEEPYDDPKFLAEMLVRVSDQILAAFHQDARLVAKEQNHAA